MLNKLENNEDFTIKISSSNPIITINNNSDLKNTASSGDGTPSDPYIIEDLFINGNGSLYCILVNNTNKYFIIKDCVLQNSSYGVYMSNVTNGLITVNYIFDNQKAGVFSKNSYNNNLTDNKVYDNDYFGIFLERCNYTRLDLNNLLNNNDTGIYLNNSLSNNITYNTINNHQYAIFLRSSNHSSVFNNNGLDNQYTIVQVNCEDNIIEENFFHKSGIKINIAEENPRNRDNESTVIDFTIVLSLCMICAGLYVFAVKFRNLNFEIS